MPTTSSDSVRSSNASSSSSTSALPSVPSSSSPPPSYLPPNLTASSIRPPSSSTSHPLLPPITNTFEPSLSTPAASAKVIPEKCLTFCSQRAEAPPLCRMFCLRRRNLPPNREEALARLRPAVASAAPTLPREVPSSWNPFDILRKKVEPYSFVYVKGTPDGVVGRYMEEMQFDDGMYDFGSISRRAKGKRREEEIEYMDWGGSWVSPSVLYRSVRQIWGITGTTLPPETRKGASLVPDNPALLHLPFTSLFHPILSIPNTINTLTTPTFNLLNLYRTSWEDGSQSRAFAKFTHEIENGGAWTMLGKVRGYWEKKVKERQDELNKIREVHREAMREQASAAGRGKGDVDSGKD